jgi:2-polyprenyl-6-methoxyphenol hydroxylase-like FAD-dependent oxidoreductase
MSLGDAHSIIPPFTGNGMSMALEAAALAVAPLRRYAVGEIDWESACAHVRETARRAFGKRLSLAGTCQSLLLAPWFRRPLEILAQEQLLPFHLLFSHTRR